MYLYEQESIMDASTDPHVIRANPKFLYNIWTLDTEVVIKNHRLYHNRIRYHIIMYIELALRVMI